MEDVFGSNRHMNRGNGIILLLYMSQMNLVNDQVYRESPGNSVAGASLQFMEGPSSNDSCQD